MCILQIAMLALIVGNNNVAILPHWFAALVVFCICIFVALFAYSMNEKH